MKKVLKGLISAYKDVNKGKYTKLEIPNCVICGKPAIIFCICGKHNYCKRHSEDFVKKEDEQ